MEIIDHPQFKRVTCHAWEHIPTGMKIKKLPGAELYRVYSPEGVYLVSKGTPGSAIGYILNQSTKEASA
jgi:hypothetical protein